MTHDQALQEGLTLINEGLVKNQEQIFDSLRTVPEDPKSPQTLKKIEKKASSMTTGKQTMLKSEVTAKKLFNPRTEVWSQDVVEFFDKAGSENSKTLGEHVLAKIRLLCPEPLFIKHTF